MVGWLVRFLTGHASHTNISPPPTPKKQQLFYRMHHTRMPAPPSVKKPRVVSPDNTSHDSKSTTQEDDGEDSSEGGSGVNGANGHGPGNGVNGNGSGMIGPQLPPGMVRPPPAPAAAAQGEEEEKEGGDGSGSGSGMNGRKRCVSFFGVLYVRLVVSHGIHPLNTHIHTRTQTPTTPTGRTLPPPPPHHQPRRGRPSPPPASFPSRP